MQKKIKYSRINIKEIVEKSLIYPNQNLTQNLTRMKTGFVSRKLLKERHFEITTEDNDIFHLSFDECVSGHFRIGDYIEFEPLFSEKYGKCALNPVYLKNTYLEELRNKIGTLEPIVGYVYEKKGFGFSVLYKEFTCYLPFGNAHLGNLALLNESEILNKHLQFLVEEDKDQSIVLTRRPFLKEEANLLNKLEIQRLNVGDVFCGKVYSTVGYGVFVTNKHSYGLLHVTNFLPNYNSSLPTSTKKTIYEAIQKSFKKGSELTVIVSAKNETTYSLSWDPQSQENKGIYFNFLEALEQI